jgi:putative ABC transport system ATP-binding protein
VLENVTLPLYYGGVDRREREARAIELIERVGLGHRLGHRPAQLSGGEKQRVAIARAVSGKPRLLLADEPTGALDTRTGNEVMELLLELHEARALTLIIVTHDPEVAEYCHRKIYLRDGKVVSDGRGHAQNA